MHCFSLARSPSTQLGIIRKFSEWRALSYHPGKFKDIKQSCPKYESLKTITVTIN